MALLGRAGPCCGRCLVVVGVDGGVETRWDSGHTMGVIPSDFADFMGKIDGHFSRKTWWLNIKKWDLLGDLEKKRDLPRVIEPIAKWK